MFSQDGSTSTDAPLETEEFTDVRPILLWYWDRSTAMQQRYEDIERFLKMCANDAKFLSEIIHNLKLSVQERLSEAESVKLSKRINKNNKKK